MHNSNQNILLYYFYFLQLFFAQKIPINYNIESNGLNKIISDPTPSGNSVEYIEFMGDDVWIATSVGLK